MMKRSPWLLLLLVILSGSVGSVANAFDPGALAGGRPRVIVSTDIGGTDPDDFQSMVHLLLYADVLDLEGLISSPFGPGRREHLLEVIAEYAKDFPHLRTYSERYPTPDALRALSKQGETEVAPAAGVRRSTEGSERIITCARRPDPRPLHVLVWGGIEDLAQALHDAPDIRPKLRVHFIGGPNKKWSPDAYQYLATHHPELWIIESNATYRGWFVGGNQAGEWGNAEFVRRHVSGHGALGTYFTEHLEGVIKMGDSPTVAWLLRGNPADPAQPSWGGRYVRAWARLPARFDRLTTESDTIEHFAILELRLPLGADAPTEPKLVMAIENQELIGTPDGRGTILFRFSPKDAKSYRYTLRGNVPSLDGRTGAITAVSPDIRAALTPDPERPHWWTDDPSPAVAEGPHHGARTVSDWREDFLRDFADRLDRCRVPAAHR